MNQIYGFEGEVKAKYTAQMFALFSEVFEWLPLAQCINGRVLPWGDPSLWLPLAQCINGRVLPWGDPSLWLPLAQCINGRVLPWGVPDQVQGIIGRVLIMHGGLFSEDGVTLDDIRKIERNRQPPDSGGHEVKAEGYEVTHGGKCVTVFSAPNYCDQMGNKGSYIHLRGSDLRPDFHQFTAVVEPQ
uniref:Serine/threonine-protein phosphatase 5 n=1 Tax=Columba livia TaxID=8932 RepID=R7VX63_COLLI